MSVPAATCAPAQAATHGPSSARSPQRCHNGPSEARPQAPPGNATVREAVIREGLVSRSFRNSGQGAKIGQEGQGATILPAFFVAIAAPKARLAAGAGGIIATCRAGEVLRAASPDVCPGGLAEWSAKALTNRHLDVRHVGA